MPLHSCHPVAPHRKLHIPDTYVSSLMLDRALDAIRRRVKRFDREHDIPYLAGYSIDGKTIYIDRHLPRTFRYDGREVDVDRYLILHEEVEKTLIEQLGLHYQHAHQIATRAEEAAVRADKISWRAYDRFMQKYIKEVWSEDLKKVPADLDQKPYRDEHDRDLLQRMKECVEGAAWRGPPGAASFTLRSRRRSPTSTRAGPGRERQRRPRSEPRLHLPSGGSRLCRCALLGLRLSAWVSAAK